MTDEMRKILERCILDWKRVCPLPAKFAGYTAKIRTRNLLLTFLYKALSLLHKSFLCENFVGHLIVIYTNFATSLKCYGYFGEIMHSLKAYFQVFH